MKQTQNPWEVAKVPRITIDGIRLRESLRLASLRVVQRLDAPSQCQVNWLTSTVGSRSMEATGIAPGVSIKVQIDAQSEAIFAGEITAVEHAHQPSGELKVQVRAYDRLARLQRRQTLRTHVDVNTAELTRILIEGVGLSIVNDDSGPIWPRVIPRFPHDLAMLRHYAARSGLHFTVQENQLRLFAFASEQRSPLALTLGENLFEARLEHNAIRAVDAVQVLGWDSHSGARREGRARSGQEPLTVATTTDGEQRSLLGFPYESDGEADARAKAELERNQLATLQLWGVAEGSIDLHPGRQVRLQGVTENMAGPHRLTVVTHTVDAKGGYLSELSTELDPVEAPPSTPGLVLGEVCDIDDPENRGRVQVELASFGDAVSNWMLVMQLGAGEGKGLVSLPEVGDQVVVAIPDGDPSTGVVLGGIYGADGPPHESGRAEGSAQHYPYTFTTRGGQRVQLNDADGSIHLQTASGSFLSLRPEGITLHAAGELVLESPGERMRLSGERIDLEQS